MAIFCYSYYLDNSNDSEHYPENKIDREMISQRYSPISFNIEESTSLCEHSYAFSPTASHTNTNKSNHVNENANTGPSPKELVLNSPSYQKSSVLSYSSGAKGGRKEKRKSSSGHSMDIPSVSSPTMLSYGTTTSIHQSIK